MFNKLDRGDKELGELVLEIGKEGNRVAVDLIWFSWVEKLHFQNLVN